VNCSGEETATYTHDGTPGREDSLSEKFERKKKWRIDRRGPDGAEGGRVRDRDLSCTLDVKMMGVPTA